MFRIYLHSKRDMEWLSLEGNLTGPGVRELERCWYTLTPSGRGQPLRLDVSRLGSMDLNGERLLRRMNGKGVTFTGLGQDVLQQCKSSVKCVALL